MKRTKVVSGSEVTENFADQGTFPPIITLLNFGKGREEGMNTYIGNR